MSEKTLARIFAVSFLISFAGVVGLVFSNKEDGSGVKKTEDLIESVNQIQKENQSARAEETNSGKQVYTNGASNPQNPISLKKEKKILEPLRENEIKSVQAITKMLSQAVSEDLSSRSFINLIKTSGLNPKATVRKNPDTGNMTTVRTSNALEGTRYFHAQFFGAEKLKDFPQHISFEIRPAANSLEVAGRMIQENFGSRAKLVESRADYRRWKTDSGQVIWAKVLDAEDVQDSPINPRDEKDIGAVWVAIEHDIHDDHGDDHG